MGEPAEKAWVVTPLGVLPFDGSKETPEGITTKPKSPRLR